MNDKEEIKELQRELSLSKTLHRMTWDTVKQLGKENGSLKASLNGLQEQNNFREREIDELYDEIHRLEEQLEIARFTGKSQ